MKFKVPINKESDFPMIFFEFFASKMQTLASEYNKWPDKVTFLGKIGKELINIIEDKGWDFTKFNISHESTLVEKIIIEYTKPIDEIDDLGYLSGDSLHGKTMDGIPGSNTVDKLKAHSLNTSFRIERKIRPTLEIKLVR